MKLTRRGDSIEMLFEPPERDLLLHSLTQLAQQYSTPWDQLPAPEQQHWLGRIAATPAEREALADEAEWLASSRKELRSHRHQLLQEWLAADAPLRLPRKPRLSLDLAAAEELLMILNDRRLLLYAQHGFTEEQMEAFFPSLPESPLRDALLEVHYLGFLQHELIEALE